MDPMTPTAYRVERIARDLHDTFTLDLQPAERGPGMVFAPGQFNMLYQFGVGEVPISISGDPGTPDRLVHTLRAVGSVTNAMARLGKGATVGVRGPFGKPYPLKNFKGKEVFIVGGGVGST